MPDGLDVSPDDVLQFTLTPKEATPKTTLTLKHPSSGSHGEPIAFKVKTTQPRRYLVRPNQGLIQPGMTEHVQILLVEKDKVQLWQSYERLGQSALDSSKDKFLVQSTKVAPSEGLKAGDYEALSNFWTKVMANTSAHGVFNTKLPVKLTASEDGAASSSKDLPSTSAKAMPKTVATNSKDVNSMSSDQLKTELTNLRSKYDELVSFSVNLTAERDILNNTLEQTKRELNKYLHKTAADGNRSNLTEGEGAAKGSAGKAMVYIAAILFWFLGSWMTHKGHTKFLSFVPVVKDFFPAPEPVEPPTPVDASEEVPEVEAETEEGSETGQEL